MDRLQSVRGKSAEKGNIPVPILHQFEDDLKLIHDVIGDMPENEKSDDISVKLNVQLQPMSIELDDIQDEVDYWNSSLMCYVLGAIPPIQVIEGYLRRVWKNHNVDKVAVVIGEERYVLSEI